jgi:hypothetical protein
MPLDLSKNYLFVTITTKFVSSNPVYGEVYSIQHYVIKFVCDLQQVGGFLEVLRFPPPIKLINTYNWNIVESGVKHHKTNQSHFKCKLKVTLSIITTIIM